MDFSFLEPAKMQFLKDRCSKNSTNYVIKTQRCKEKATSRPFRIFLSPVPIALDQDQTQPDSQM